MKPKSKAESRHAAIEGGRHGRTYYPGSKPFMKRKLARARRRTEKVPPHSIDLFMQSDDWGDSPS